MSNILEAISNISQLKQLSVKNIIFGSNRATHVGDGLESFIKDAFTNTFFETDKTVKHTKYSEAFSYEGSSRTPPDLMLRNGDAIEVKKTESLTTDLQLNSSHPKAKLNINSILINKHCKTCYHCTEKDFIYAIGHLPKGTKTLSSLWFIDGNVYSADEQIYLQLKDDLNTSIESTPNIDFSPTNEIGRVNNVDPLKVTHLRIRGMWLLKQPFKVFDYVHEYDERLKFQCITILQSVKYDSFPTSSKSKIENADGITIKNIQVRDPNNPMNLLDCKLIRFVIT